MDDEKRMVGDYEVGTSVWLGHKEYLLGEDKSGKSEMPYMTCVVTRNQFFDIHEDMITGDDYLEIFNIFTDRLSEQAQELAAQRSERSVTATPLTVNDCVKGGLDKDLEGQIIIIRASCILPEYRTADNQIMIAESGNGCNPTGRGNAVFCKKLYTGEKMRYERYDVAGVADVARLPEWAQQKAAEIEKSKEKPSMLKALDENKKNVSQQNTVIPKKKKNGHEI